MSHSRRSFLQSTMGSTIALGFSSAVSRSAPDLAKLDGLAQSELVRKREITALELVDAAINRIEAVNPNINAIVTTFFERVRKAAKKTLSAWPFAGAPSLVKDINEYMGTPQHLRLAPLCRQYFDAEGAAHQGL